MAYIPKDAKWWIAELVEEIRVQGEKQNVVHLNTLLIRADSPDEAYERALELGRAGNTQYENPARRKVRIRFRGISHLDVIHDELEHGAELWFDEKRGVSEDRIRHRLKRKHELEAFLPPGYMRKRFRARPDYSSREVLEEVKRRFGLPPQIERRLRKSK